MGIDTEKLHRLKGKSFNKLYEDHKAEWDDLVKSTAKYAQQSMKGEKPRRADVAAIVYNTVKIHPHFEAHVSAPTRKLAQKYWGVWFSDYIVEQVYPSPEIEENNTNE